MRTLPSPFLPALLLLLALLLAGTAARAQTALQVQIDLRAEIAAGRFDPQRDRVGLRGAAPPLSWSQTMLAAPDERRPGFFTIAVNFEATPAQPLAYKFKIELQGQPDAGWEEGTHRTLLLKPGAQTLERAFSSRTQPRPLQRSGHIDRIAALPSKGCRGSGRRHARVEHFQRASSPECARAA